jgi:SlyX protein
MVNTPEYPGQLEELQQRIENLEMRNAFQDDVIDKLNHELTIHQEQLADFKFQVGVLAERVKNFQNNAVARPEDETPPPHY